MYVDKDIQGRISICDLTDSQAHTLCLAASVAETDLLAESTQSEFLRQIVADIGRIQNEQQSQQIAADAQTHIIHATYGLKTNSIYGTTKKI